jgi:hypothetical protein
MAFALPAANPIIEMRQQQLSFYKHAQAITDMRAMIDTSPFPACRRLLVWTKRAARDRARQRACDSERM